MGNRGYKELQLRVTKVNRSYRGLQGVTGITGGYKGIQRVTRGYRGLQGVTVGHEGLQGVRNVNAFLKMAQTMCILPTWLKPIFSRCF